MTKYAAVASIYEDAISILMPDFPGFAVQHDGTDIQAAMEEAESVLADYTGTMIYEGLPLPTPMDFLAGAKEAKRGKLADLDADRTALLFLTARPRAPQPQRLNISLDTETIALIDESRKVRGLTRSGYITAAARAYG